MEELNMNNLLSADEINNLFSEDTNVEETQETSPESEETRKETTTEEINVDDLFTDTSESVGSEDDSKEKEDTKTEKSGSSPKNNNFYSSIAKALKVDGVLPELADEDADKIQDPEDFAELIEKHIQSKFDERQKRIDDALNSGVEANVIKEYENTLQYLNSITEEQLNAEGEEGEDIRRRLIFQDLINKGYTQEEAVEEVKDIFEAGTDIKKALRAKTSNIDFFQKGYNKVLSDAKEAANKDKKEREQQTEALRKSILEDNKVFGELELDKATRQKVFDAISKPIHKDENTGELYTALGKYEKENKTDFLKYVGLVFTLTDGFKNLDGLVKTKVNKEVKKGLRELEHTLNNTSRTSDGNLKFVSGVNDDPNTFLSKWDLDV